MPNPVAFGLISFLHDLFTAIWIGGLIVLGLAVLPEVRRTLERGPAGKSLMRGIQKRLSVLVYISIVGLLLTGVLLARRSPQFLGLLATGNTYSLLLATKHVVVVVMVAVALYRSLVLGRRPGPLSPSEEQANAGLLLANIVLGVGVLLLSGLAAAFATAPPPV